MIGLVGYASLAAVELLYIHEIALFPRMMPSGILSMVLSYIAIISDRYEQSFCVIEDLVMILKLTIYRTKGIFRAVNCRSTPKSFQKSCNFSSYLSGIFMRNVKRIASLNTQFA